MDLLLLIYIYIIQKALAFHHTFFKKRQINVELTAGGGGNNENRKEKLKIKKDRLTEERVS
jgi:nucleolar protein 6